MHNRTHSRVSLETLASRLAEAHFQFERQADLLVVRDSRGGRVEFLSGEDENDFRADVYDARRVLLVNLITALQVYGLTAHFHFIRKGAPLFTERLIYGT